MIIHGFSLWARRHDHTSRYAGNSNSTDWTWWAFGPPFPTLPSEDLALLRRLSTALRRLNYVTADLQHRVVRFEVGRLEEVAVGRRSTFTLTRVQPIEVLVPEGPNQPLPPELPVDTALQWVYADRVMAAADHESTNIDGLVTHGEATYAVEVKARRSDDVLWYVALKHTQHRTLGRLRDQAALHPLIVVRSLRGDESPLGWQAATLETEWLSRHVLYVLSRPVPTLTLAGLLGAQQAPNPEPMASRARRHVEHPVIVADDALLSSLAPCRISLRGAAYPSVRHAFLAAQTLDEDKRAFIQKLDHAALLSAERDLTRRADWAALESQVALRLTQVKFRDRDRRQRLLETLPVELIGPESKPLLVALQQVRAEAARASLKAETARRCSNCSFARPAERPDVLGCDHFDAPWVPLFGLSTTVPVGYGKAFPLSRNGKIRGEAQSMSVVPLHAAGCQFWRPPSG